MNKFLICAVVFFVSLPTVFAQNKEFTPTFYKNGQPVDFVFCGESFTFDVSGYPEKTVWLEQWVTRPGKNQIKIFNGPFSLPMPSYKAACNKDEGDYITYVYAISNNARGRQLGLEKFSIESGDGSFANAELKFLDTGIFSLKLSKEHPAIRNVLYFNSDGALLELLRSYKDEMETMILVSTPSLRDSVRDILCYGCAWSVRFVVDGIGKGKISNLFPKYNQLDRYLTPRGRLNNIAIVSSYNYDNKEINKKINEYLPEFLYVILHELGHEWSTFAAQTETRQTPFGISTIRNPLAILVEGEQFAHWGYVSDNHDSLMAYGPARLQENPDNSFTPILKGRTYVFNDFDLYFMGVLSPKNVQPTFSVFGPFFDENIKRVGTYDTFKGIRQNVTVNDIIRLEGPRNPASGISVNNRTNNVRVTFLIVQGPEGTEEELNIATNLVRRAAADLPTAWEKATKGLSSLSVFTPSKRQSLEGFAVSLPEEFSDDEIIKKSKELRAVIHDDTKEFSKTLEQKRKDLGSVISTSATTTSTIPGTPGTVSGQISCSISRVSSWPNGVFEVNASGLPSGYNYNWDAPCSWKLSSGGSSKMTITCGANMIKNGKVSVSAAADSSKSGSCAFSNCPQEGCPAEAPYVPPPPDVILKVATNYLDSQTCVDDDGQKYNCPHDGTWLNTLSGQAPLSGIDLWAVPGNQTVYGSVIAYKVDCESDGKNDATVPAIPWWKRGDATVKTKDVCSYKSPGNYTATVTAISGSWLSFGACGWLGNYLTPWPCRKLGDGTAAIQVAKPQQTPFVNFSGPSTVSYGKDATLYWFSKYATSCTASASPPNPNWSGSQLITGSRIINKLNANTVFTLSCYNAEASSSENVAVKIVDVPSQFFPTVSLRGPNSVPYDSSETLTWTTTNATSCTASASPPNPHWDGLKPVSGSQSIGKLTVSTIFTLSCAGLGNAASDNIITTVAVPSEFELKAGGISVISRGNSTATSNSTKITVNTFEGFSNNINLSVQSVSPNIFGAVFNFSDTTLDSNEYYLGSNFSVTVPASIRPGIYAIKVLGTDGNLARSVDINLSVNVTFLEI